MGPVLDVPAADDHQHADERVEKTERQRNAVYAQVVVDIERFDPDRFLDKLHVCRGLVKTDIQQQRQYKGHQGDDQRQNARRLRRAASERDHANGADDREPGYEAEQGPIQHQSNTYRSSMKEVVRATRATTMTNA